MSPFPRHRVRPARKHPALRVVVISLATVLVAALTGGFFVYRHLEDNIVAVDVEEALGDVRRPKVFAPKTTTDVEVEHDPLNILLLGSDTREGQGNDTIGGETPGLSDTTILLHLSADRDRAYGVSIPRDAMVERPACDRKDGQGVDPGGLAMFNAAYAIGGPACTIKTLEKISRIRINHFVVVDFNGFKAMVDALDGVPVCVPREVNDDIGKIYMRAGSYEVKGQEALDYVRLRHELSENGDIGRMKRQQTFLAAMANKAVSAGTLANPIRLYRFLDAATSSLTTDTELADLQKLASLGSELKGIGLDKIQFLTVPFETYPPDPNRLQIAPEAEALWKRLKHDEPLTRSQSESVTTAAGNPDGKPSKGPSSSPRGNETKAEAAERLETAEANGLCT